MNPLKMKSNYTNTLTKKVARWMERSLARSVGWNVEMPRKKRFFWNDHQRKFPNNQLLVARTKTSPISV